MLYISSKSIFSEVINKLNGHPEHQWNQAFLPPSCHMREGTGGILTIESSTDSKKKCFWL
jgi:hypothetical protein